MTDPDPSWLVELEIEEKRRQLKDWLRETLPDVETIRDPRLT